MSDKVHVAVVLVNYRTPRLTIECVESVLGSRGISPRVILVDNASGDDSVACFRNAFADNPAVTVVARTTNDGYTGGNNAGVAIAARMNARYALLLNSDTIVDPDCVRLLVEEADRDPRVALVNPCILVGGSPDRLWFGGSRFSRWRGRPVHVEGRRETSDEVPRDLDFATGCALLVTLDALGDEPVFDTSLFSYAEDLDLSLRMADRGRRIGYVPAARVWHYEGSSHRQAGGQALRFYLSTRNQLRVAARHARWYHWPALAPMLAIDVVGRFAAVTLRDRDLPAFAAVLRGALHAFTGGTHPIERG